MSIEEFTDQEIKALQFFVEKKLEFVNVEILMNETNQEQSEVVNTLAQLCLKGLIEYHGFNREIFVFEWKFDLENARKQLKEGVKRCQEKKDSGKRESFLDGLLKKLKMK